MIADKTKKLEEREKFVKQYKAAIAAKLSKEQLAGYLNVKPDSITRRRLVIQDTLGFALPYLTSTESSEIPEEQLKKFRAELGKLTKEEKRILIDNESLDKYDFTKYDRLVITSAQNATPIHEDFFAVLLNYCKVNNAKLVVIPYRYKNPTSIFQDKDHDWWEPKIIPYMYEDQFKVIKHLQILGHIKKQPTAIQPLHGLEGQTGLDSAIVGHPKIQLKTIPTPSQQLPKLLMSTGAITLPNYTDSGAGWRGLHHHSYAAVVVELDRKNDIFHLRHIHGDRDTGNLYDLDKYYTTTTVSKAERASALVTGDSHAIFMDPEVEKATYTNKDSIVNVLQPETLVLHDVLDGYSISHHHKHSDVIKIGKHRYKMGNIEDELQITADFIDRISQEGMQTVIVKSNHDEHFDRWLQECDYKNDPENAQFWHWMKYNQGKYIEQTKTGFKTIDPFEFWCSNPDRQRGLLKKHLIKILKRDQSLMVNNIELSFHGDKGSGGARGSMLGFSKVGPKVVIGHSHTPGIYEGVYQVGLSSYMDLEYKTGCDSWLHTHCIVYPDGKRTLINVIRGKWRL